METEKDLCPGSQIIRQPVPGDYPCLQCGQMVEIWTNEAQRKCPNCGNMVMKKVSTSS